MIQELISRLSPEEVVRLNDNLNKLADVYKLRGVKKTYEFVKSLGSPDALPSDKEEYYRGFDAAIKFVHEQIRDNLIFNKNPTND